jgi:hypothetical protein
MASTSAGERTLWARVMPPNPIATGGVDSGVLGELVAAPERDPDAARLEEAGLLDLLPTPPEPLVELVSAPDVGDAQGDEAEPLFQ